MSKEHKKEHKVELLSETIKFKCTGLAPIMMDRFLGMKGEFPPEQKLYLEKGNGLIVPAKNLHSFYFGEKPGGCVKRFLDPKEFKKVILSGQAYIAMKAISYPLMRETEQIIFNGFDKNERDEKAKIYVDRDKGISKGTTPLSLVRPVIELPWWFEFEVEIYKNDLFDRTMFYNWTVRGGIEVAIFNHRCVYGRFLAEEI